ADLHSVQPGEDIAGSVGELAGQFPVDVAEELTALRVRGVTGDTELLEGEGVDDSAVSGSVHDVDFPVAGDFIELVASGVAPFGEVALFVAEPADRHTGGQLLRFT